MAVLFTWKWEQVLSLWDLLCLRWVDAWSVQQVIMTSNCSLVAMSFEAKIEYPENGYSLFKVFWVMQFYQIEKSLNFTKKSQKLKY